MWRTIGHEKAVNLLKRSLAEGRVSHAYLLAGPGHVGKMTLALDLARALNCVEEKIPCGECGQCRRIARGLHADVRVVGLDTGDSRDGPSRVLIGIDQVREVQREASLKPFEGSHRVFIFDGVERLSEEAANCLLKTLEEPPDQVVLVLLTAEAGTLLPTLVSRCQTLELRPVSRSLISRELQAGYNADVATADEIARLSEGKLGWALNAISSPAELEGLERHLGAIETVVRSGPMERFACAANLASSFGRNRDSVHQELAVWLSWWRDVLLAKEGVHGPVTHLSRLETFQAVADALSTAEVAGAINAVQDTMRYLDRNVNPRLALEALMLSLPRP
jgi:DNA polymerase-3 subunit delta'